eukprot:m.75268 g.75268  ORF g.75268 m.75268 type:complete len:92 (-) comp24761_c1_seq1:1612-1887(-)
MYMPPHIPHRGPTPSEPVPAPVPWYLLVSLSPTGPPRTSVHTVLIPELLRQRDAPSNHACDTFHGCYRNTLWPQSSTYLKCTKVEAKAKLF